MNKKFYLTVADVRIGRVTLNLYYDASVSKWIIEKYDGETNDHRYYGSFGDFDRAREKFSEHAAKTINEALADD